MWGEAWLKLEKPKYSQNLFHSFFRPAHLRFVKVNTLNCFYGSQTSDIRDRYSSATSDSFNTVCTTPVMNFYILYKFTA